MPRFIDLSHPFEWGTEAYQAYPYIGEDLIDFLIDAGVALVGVDTVNIDNSQDLTRPTHTRFLAREIFIVENLTYKVSRDRQAHGSAHESDGPRTEIGAQLWQWRPAH